MPNSALADLLFHPRTHKQLADFVDRPGHGVLLEGPMGSGKETTARALAAALLSIEPSINGKADGDDLANYPYLTIINPSTPTITIDEIRAAQNLLVLKVPRGTTVIRRIIIIIDAERMRSEAQNAFLKTLEEPPADTCIILTSNGEKLLPTITSRVRPIKILPVSKSQAIDYYSKKGTPSHELAKHYALSQGQMGLLNALISNDAHELGEWVQTAKEILSEPVGVRLLRTDGLSKEKSDIRLLLDALSRIAHSALMQAASQNKHAAIQRWSQSQLAIQESLKALKYNASTKLLLDDLFLSL